MKVSNTRHDDPIGFFDDTLIGGDYSCIAEMFDGPFDGRDITCPVIDDGDHNSPFVLGNMRRKRRSCQQAARRARAKALKIDSIL